MVASFYSRDKAANDQAVARARDLVEELRSKRLPAYLYVQESKFDAQGEVQRFDMYGVKKPVQFRDFFYVAVLAGDFEHIDEKKAQSLLAKVKAYKPKCMEDEQIRIPPGAPGPLWRAFLTPNPLTVGKNSPRQNHLDPFVVKLNDGREFSLLDCPAPISVVVATFSGAFALEAEIFEKIAKRNLLEQAGVDAEDLARALKQLGYDAYVFHDRERSVVTVGSFHDVKDPRLMTTLKAFSPLKDAGGQTTPRTLKDPKTKKDRWVFDVQPMPIRVPQP
jgi:hypothetical protein